jgi:hypothetical protein
MSPKTRCIRLRDERKQAILRELKQLAQVSHSRSQTVLGRFLQCQELQVCSALLAKAIEQCSRWHRGKALLPPAGSLPPTN